MILSNSHVPTTGAFALLPSYLRGRYSPSSLDSRGQPPLEASQSKQTSTHYSVQDNLNKVNSKPLFKLTLNVDSKCKH